MSFKPLQPNLFPTLLSELRVGKITVRNRILSTGHDTNMARDGKITDEMIAYQEKRAANGVGLIVVQVSGIHDSARYTNHVLMADTDDCIPGYVRMVNAVHKHGARVFGQLFHPGKEILESIDGGLAVAYAPSAVPNSRFRIMPVALSKRMIKVFVDGYAAAATRMKKAGFDGCEIVASHGYLPAQFLNPYHNIRTDEYGGDLANRMRFLSEAVGAVRAAVGTDFVIGVRITGEEFDHNAIEPDDVISTCVALEKDHQADYFSVVAGTATSIQGSIHITPPMAIAPGYAAPFAAALKSKVKLPVFVTGRINQPHVAEQILAAGSADMCGMTRALICDPEMPAKVYAGRHEDIRACIGCNQACIGHVHKGFPVSCIQHPETGRELNLGRRVPATKRKKVLVAGGGPAGMKAAAVLAERGHTVTLCEASSNLGGQVLLAQLLPRRAEFGGAATNLKREIENAGIDVRMRTSVTRDFVEKHMPDAVVIATGAVPRVPPIEGLGDMQVVDAWQLLQGKAQVGQSVVIADWRCDWIGLGLAEMLARNGCRVRLCVEGVTPGDSIPWFVRDEAIGTIQKLRVEVLNYARLYGVDSGTAYFTHVANGEPIILEGVDSVVLAQGHHANSILVDEIEGTGVPYHVIGDCLTPRSAEEAILEGLKIGSLL